MKNFGVKNLCLGGVFIALVCLGTMFFSVRVPVTEGYINFGDGFIIIISVLFGKKFGALAGGIGSALADLFLAPHWAVFTLIIKGFMGYAVGCVKDYADENSHFFSVRNILSSFVGEVVMVVGYFVFGAILKGYFMLPDTAEISGFMAGIEYGALQASTSVFPNVIQGIGGIIIFQVLGFALHNVKAVRFAR